MEWSLDGRWGFRFDPDDAGRTDGWFEPGRADRLPWRSIDVPCAWNEQFGEDTPDVAWYRRQLPAGDDARRWVCFGAVCTDLEVWFDGRPCGRHVGNWAPVQFELPHGGAGELIVRVDRLRPGAARKIGDRVEERGHIAKGFHDILSRQPAGLWQGVTLRGTGPLALRPLGLHAVADCAGGGVAVTVETEPFEAGGEVEVELRDPAGQTVAVVRQPLSASAVEAQLQVDRPRRWSPDDPALYTVGCRLLDGDGASSDERAIRVGFREARGDGGRILLNGQPVFLSGMLDWGHEPMRTAPAPSPPEVRRRFAALKALGINCICVCMWYPPPWFYDIADETGMLIWQEHPFWKSPMRPELMPEYREHYERFFRMDRNHASVIVVSGSCEHDNFDPALAQWWWRRAADVLPDRVRQVQTAFLRLVPPEQTDLYDEHTYENSGRWPEFLEDMDAALEPLPAKPFVMGESVLYNDWPDTAGLLASLGDDRPWWVWRSLDAAVAFERGLEAEHGGATLERFRGDARRWHIAGRKWQTEVFRMQTHHAGLVQNGLRDVALCPLGFMDDYDQLRIGPGDARPWLAPAVLLLKSPDMMRGFFGKRRLHLSVGVSNFGAGKIEQALRLSVEGAGRLVGDGPLRLAARPGEQDWVDIAIDLPEVSEPQTLTLSAGCDGTPGNRWRLWVLPRPVWTGLDIAHDGADGRSDVEASLDFEERRYSSGWGLDLAGWRVRPPDFADWLPEARAFTSAAPSDADVLVVSALTDDVLDKLARGARVLHLPTKRPGSLRTVVPTLWGQSPLILDRGPLAGVATDCVRELLDRDLHARWIRSVPVTDLGIDGDVEPLIRQVKTHDAGDRLTLLDDLFAAAVGEGVLLVSTLDHGTEPGRFLLPRLCDWLGRAEPGGLRRLCPELLAAGRRDAAGQAAGAS